MIFTLECASLTELSLAIILDWGYSVINCVSAAVVLALK